jgi:hypothetical protein
MVKRSLLLVKNGTRPVIKLAINLADNLVNNPHPSHLISHLFLFFNANHVPGEVEKGNIETCPACNEPLVGGEEKLVIGGKEWHKNCYWASQSRRR